MTSIDHEVVYTVVGDRRRFDRWGASIVIQGVAMDVGVFWGRRRAMRAAAELIEERDKVVEQLWPKSHPFPEVRVVWEGWGR